MTTPTSPLPSAGLDLPILRAATPTTTAAGTSIALDFNLAMAAGDGVIYVTDGALQTVIDRVTGLPTTRVVGATDTHALSAADLAIDGVHVTLAVNGLLAGHTYSLVMGAGTLVSNTGMVFGGVASTSQIQFTTPAAETPPPVPVSVASIVFSDTGPSATDGVTAARAEHVDGTLSAALTAGQYVELTIDGHSVGADAVGIDPLDATHWTFNGDNDLDDGQHTLSARVVDANGNAGAATSVQMLVDTLAPTFDAAGLHGNVDPAADVVIQLSEPVYWTGDSALLTLGRLVGGAYVSSDIAFDPSWLSQDHKTLTIGAAALALAPGAAYHLAFTGGLVDLAGNALDQTAIDFATAAGTGDVPPPPTPTAAAPVLATGSDSGVKGDNITNDSTPTLTGTTAPGMKKVYVYDGDTLLGHTNVDDGGAWSFTVNNGHALADGVHQLTVRASASEGEGDDDDAAGAPSAPLALTIDTVAPTVTATHTSLQGLKTWLSVEFSEKIVFATGGAVDVSDIFNLQQSHHAWNVMTNWDIANNTAGVASVLELNLGVFIGAAHLTIENDAIQDVAGNVAIIGNSGYINPVYGA